MPFVTKDFVLPEPIKAFLFIMQALKCSQKQAQKHLDKNRLKQDGNTIHKSQTIQGKVSLTYFEANNLELQPIFITPYFAIYDKPPKLLTHPKGYFEHSSLCDAFKLHFGKQANPIHRLDYETSGLIIVGIKKNYETSLKELFATKSVQKSYLAVVQGQISSPLTINLPIQIPKKSDKYKDLGIRCKISPKGKPSITQIYPISYDSRTNTTLLEVIPLTGRTHQIRIHLYSIGHKIIGEPLYGVDNQSAREYLAQKSFNTKLPRLMLHSQSLSFTFKNIHYYIKSNADFPNKL